MRRVYQVASLSFLVLSIFAVYEAGKLSYYAQLGLTRLGPGPGFFPFWLGLLMVILSLAWFAQVTFRQVEPMPEGYVPGREGISRILCILLALVLYTATLGVLGFTVATFCFSAFLLVALGRHHPVLTLAISLIGSFGVFHLFQQWLEVYLPTSSIELLQNLGL